MSTHKAYSKLDLKDFNQDGTDELVMLYTAEGERRLSRYIDVWTVEDGEARYSFSLGRSRDESHEAAMSFCLYTKMAVACTFRYMILWTITPCMFIYTASTRIGNFGEVYQYENNAFYMNQLPDGMEFAGCEETLSFYSNTQFAYYDDFENIKEEMRESLQIDMVNMLNELGIAVPENSSTQTN